MLKVHSLLFFKEISQICPKIGCFAMLFWGNQYCNNAVKFRNHGYRDCYSFFGNLLLWKTMFFRNPLQLLLISLSIITNISFHLFSQFLRCCICKNECYFGKIKKLISPNHFFHYYPFYYWENKEKRKLQIHFYNFYLLS